MLKETGDTNKEKDLLCSWTGRFNFNTIKMSILPKANYRLNAIITKFPMAFFAEIEKKILNFIHNIKGHQAAKTILRKKTSAEGLTLPKYKTSQSYCNLNITVLA